MAEEAGALVDVVDVTGELMPLSEARDAPEDALPPDPPLELPPEEPESFDVLSFVCPGAESLRPCAKAGPETMRTPSSR